MHTGFCAAAMRKERSLCTQFLLTLKKNLSLQLVGETDMQESMTDESCKRYEKHNHSSDKH